MPHPAGAPAEPPRLKVFTLPELDRHVFEHRRPLLQRDDTVIVREGHISEIFGPRGIGKTWLTQTLALIASTGTSALGFHTEEPVRVLYVDGEMAGPDLQERFTRLQEMLAVKGTANLVVLGADWQETFLPRLDTAAGRVAVEPFVEAADLVICDNRSTLFDPESECDPVAWQPAQDWLLSLRRRRKATLLVHHSNRQGGARGHSKPEDVMNVLIKLSRPDGYTADQGATFLVEFDKTRGIYGAGVAPFTATLTPTGWRVDGVDTGTTVIRKLRNYLQLAHTADDRPKSATAAITAIRVRREAGLAAWTELKQHGELHEHPKGGFYLA